MRHTIDSVPEAKQTKTKYEKTLENKSEHNSGTVQMEQSDTTVVKIFGREYPLKCDDNAEMIQRIADLVDAKMRVIANTTSLSSHSDIAVLAALNLTHELIGDQLSPSASSDEFSSRAESLLSKLDATLPDLEPALRD